LRGLKAERLCISQQAGDAEKFASESSDFDLIVSAGGDGTLNEVVNGIAQGGCKAALGVLPLGTGNDFARTLGVPTDLETAIEQIMAGKTRAIDLVRVTSDRVRYFVNVSQADSAAVVDENLTRK
jgi:diacylglycerol kinase (ATP)